jgi:hypothetical protein
MVKIVGAGLAGLLAANMLRNKGAVIEEKQTSLPNNHSAVLRFRSQIVGDVVGIEFRKVEVIKASLPWMNPIADALAYSDKNTQVFRSDRSIPHSIVKAERYIAPEGLIETLASNVNHILYGIENAFDYVSRHGRPPVISTIPMPALMNILEYPERKKINFQYVSGVNIIAKVERCDAFVSLYVPDPSYAFSRVSLTGNELVAECPNDKEWYHTAAGSIATLASNLLGIEGERITDVVAKRQSYAKIVPIDDGDRKRFISWASDNFNIYSLGRYACWRPTLMLDDLVHDIRLIERWINGGQSYARKLHSNKQELT